MLDSLFFGFRLVFVWDSQVYSLEQIQIFLVLLPPLLSLLLVLVWVLPSQTGERGKLLHGLVVSVSGGPLHDVRGRREHVLRQTDRNCRCVPSSLLRRGIGNALRVVFLTLLPVVAGLGQLAVELVQNLWKLDSFHQVLGRVDFGRFYQRLSLRLNFLNLNFQLPDQRLVPVFFLQIGRKVWLVQYLFAAGSDSWVGGNHSSDDNR